MSMSIFFESREEAKVDLTKLNQEVDDLQYQLVDSLDGIIALMCDSDMSSMTPRDICGICSCLSSLSVFMRFSIEKKHQIAEMISKK